MHGFTQQSNKDFEICIINDGGDRSISKIIEYYSKQLNIQYYYLEPPTTKFRLATARNYGLNLANGSRIITTDDDCIPHINFIDHHITDKNIIKVGFRRNINKEMIYNIKEIDLELMPFISDSRLTFDLLNNPEQYCFGCNISYPKQKILDINGYNNQFIGWGYEDLELIYRTPIDCQIIFDYNCIVYHIIHPSRKNPFDLEQIKNLEILNKTKRVLKEKKLFHQAMIQ